MSTLTVTTQGAVALVTLDDPARRNMLTLAMASEIAAAFDRIEADGGIRAVVVTGAGTAFCAGADLQLILDGKPADFRCIYEAFLRVRRCPLPTIAAVNGPATGAGLNLVLSCDICITSPQARLIARFLDIGIHPGGGNTWMLSRAVGPTWTKAMLLCNEELDGATAVAAGLALRCVAPDQLIEEAMRLAQRSAALPPAVLARTKQTIDAMPAVPEHGTAVEIEAQAQAWSLTQPEFRERVDALKRQIAERSKGRK